MYLFSSTHILLHIKNQTKPKKSPSLLRRSTKKNSVMQCSTHQHRRFVSPDSRVSAPHRSLSLLKNQLKERQTQMLSEVLNINTIILLGFVILSVTVLYILDASIEAPWDTDLDDTYSASLCSTFVRKILVSEPHSHLFNKVESHTTFMYTYSISSCSLTHSTRSPAIMHTT